MKKVIAIIIVITIIIAVFIFLPKMASNRFGADSYYVQIMGIGTKTESKSTVGEVYVLYEYTLPAFDKKGNEKEFTFTADHELRKDAYLNLFVKEGKGVTSYQEVQKNEIPADAIKKLN